MKSSIINSLTRLRATQFVLIIVSLTTLTLKSPAFTRTEAAKTTSPTTTTQPPLELLRGFKAKPDPSTPSFQPLLRDDTGNLSFGFLRTNQTLLSLAVLHVPSSDPLWVTPANPTRNLRWSDKAELVFNGSLVITGPGSRAEWSTGAQNGDRVVLLNSSNLQIRSDVAHLVLWQSFDFPGNTLVEGQNFTDAMSLVSSNGLYSLKLGRDFWGLYAAFRKGHEQLYLKHTALEARAEIVDGKGPIYIRVNPNGYLGMYQTGTGPEVDIQPFSSYQRRVDGPLIVRLEPDGNLRGYYWDGSASKWALNYEAIKNPCELPSPCGSYGLCNPGSGCSCLDNRTEYNSGGCSPARVTTGDFCGDSVGKSEFSVIRRRGVELPFKELMGYETASSVEECEGMCAENCSCWGAVYNNNSGFCYTVEYPIQTLLAVADQSKAGYFKVREGAERDRVGVLFRAGICLLVGVILVFSVFVGILVHKAWKRKRGVSRFLEQETGGLSPGPYKDLGSASFRSLEMCNR